MPDSKCHKCNLPKQPEGSGSITQWIFKKDVCCCAEGGRQTAPPAVPSAQSRLDADELVELEVDPGKFPVGRYRPLKIIGEGASSTVYLCKDMVLGKRVALKLLKETSSSQLIGFQREAQAVSRLSHPNIASIFDFSVTDSGIPYMVSPYFKGLSLSECIKQRGPLRPAEAISLFIALCSACSHAHEKNVFHRDLKPENIILCEEDGQPRIIDFGIALMLGTAATLSEQGKTIVGTPAFMSPDQASGLTYDARSEIYTLGCILFVSLTGVPPFDAATPLELLALHASVQPPSLNDYLPASKLTNALKDIVQKCLQKDPNDRFQTPQDLQKALEQLDRLDNQPSEPAAVGVRKKNGPIPKVVAVSVSIALVSLALFSCLSGSKLASPDKRTTTIDLPSVDQSFDNQSVSRKKLAFWRTINFKSPYVWYTQLNKKITLSAMEEVIGLRETKCLYLRDAEVDEGCFTSLPGSNIIALDLDGVVLADSDFRSLCRSKQIEKLVLRAYPLNDERLQLLTKLPKLDALDLEDCHLTDDQLKTVCRIKTLNDLELGGNSELTVNGLKHLKSLPELSYLLLSGTNVTIRDLEQSGIVASKISRLRLNTCPNIRALDVENLREQMPKCKIECHTMGGTNAAEVNEIWSDLGEIEP